MSIGGRSSIEAVAQAQGWGSGLETPLLSFLAKQGSQLSGLHSAREPELDGPCELVANLREQPCWQQPIGDRGSVARISGPQGCWARPGEQAAVSWRSAGDAGCGYGDIARRWGGGRAWPDCGAPDPMPRRRFHGDLASVGRGSADPICRSRRSDRRSAQPDGRRARGATAAQDRAGLGAAHELSIQSRSARGG